MYLKKFLFKGPFKPSHEANLMAYEGDVERARNQFLKKRFKNLDFLLENRFVWMNKYINPDDRVIEVGSGAAFSQFYIKNKILHTDFIENKPSWINKNVNAMEMEKHFDHNSIDVIIASHTIHHFSCPRNFFQSCLKILKPNGYILINEINTSLVTRFFLYIMNHEGWSYEDDVFSSNDIKSDDDNWEANCAIAELLFSNHLKFEKEFPGLSIEKEVVGEFLIFPLSGGVIAKRNIPEMPLFFLKLIKIIDDFLIKFLPGIFGMTRNLVLRKKV